jgi:glyoxylase-like metal-dependent hydrolase (beta-lactamase superfamily II)
MEPMKILTLLNGPVEENCYVLSEGSQALVIDPGSSPKELMSAIDSQGLKPVLILATHAHFDHVGAVEALAKAYGAPFAMHAADLKMLETLEDTYTFYGMGKTQKPVVSRELKGGDRIDAAGIQLKAIHTPGHTPGGLCFYHEASGSLFSGDTLFRRSIGRSDFEGGDQQKLVASIKSQLLTLPETTKVYPGHGEPTSIAEEKKENAFL